MRKLLTIGILLTMLSMPSNVNAQRFVDRANNAIERVNRVLEQAQPATPAPRPAETARENNARVVPVQNLEIETETAVAVETVTVATLSPSGRPIDPRDGVRIIREGRGDGQNTPSNIELFNSGSWIRFHWRVPTGGCPGGVSYLWQQSSDGRTWTNAPGTNTERAYTTQPITADTYFRRLTTDDCGVTFSTETVRITLDRTIWATRNVDMPGTFATNPQDAGRFYQWNRRTSWTATGDITGWNNTGAIGIVWERANDPCPPGWRVPTRAEFDVLARHYNRWVNNWNGTGVNGRLFGTAPNQIFMPAVGRRESSGVRGAGEFGDFWGRNYVPDGRWPGWLDGMRFTAREIATSQIERNAGFSIRCVAE